MAAKDLRPPTRPELKKIFQDQRTLRAFEQVFELIPGDLIELENRIKQAEQDIDALGLRVDQNEADIASLKSRVTQNELDIAYLLNLVPEVVIATGSFTTTGNAVIACTNTGAITVTLNPAPEQGETVSITRRDAPVTVSGAINGASGIKLRSKYDSPSLVYIGTEWSLV